MISLVGAVEKWGDLLGGGATPSLPCWRSDAGAFFLPSRPAPASFLVSCNTLDHRTNQRYSQAESSQSAALTNQS